MADSVWARTGGDGSLHHHRIGAGRKYGGPDQPIAAGQLLQHHQHHQQHQHDLQHRSQELHGNQQGQQGQQGQQQHGGAWDTSHAMTAILQANLAPPQTQRHSHAFDEQTAAPPPSLETRHPSLLEIAMENEMLTQQLFKANSEVMRLSSMVSFLNGQGNQQDLPQRDKARKGREQSRSRYWTDTEQAMFLEAVKTFGANDHKAIAAAVGTRNATQVRTHAQKYFKKLARTKGKNGEREQEQAGNISAKDEDAASTMEKNAAVLRDNNNGAVLRRDGQKKTGEGGGTGAMAAAAAAAGASEGAPAAAFVTVTGAAGGSFPDVKSEENGGGGQVDNCEETGEGKRSINKCVASSTESTQQGTGTSGCDSRQGGSDSPSSSLGGKGRICGGDFSGSRFGEGAESGWGNSARDYDKCDKRRSDNNSSPGNGSKKSGSPVFQESGSDDGTGSCDGRSPPEGRDTGFEFAEASPEAQAAPPTS